MRSRCITRARIAAAALTLVSVLALPASASALQITVNDNGTGPGPAGANCGAAPFTTIQAAVNAASPGDEILVCAGTYSAGAGVIAVNTTKQLVFKGAQAGVDARTRSVPIASESVVSDADGAFSLSATGVVIDGFITQGATSPNFGSIFTNGPQSGIQLLNNIVRQNSRGPQLSSAGAPVSVIRHNLFADNNAPGPGSGVGLYLQAGASNYEIDENTFDGNTNIALLVEQSGPGSDNLTITDNTSDNRFRLTDASDVTIERNTIQDSVRHGVQLAGGVDGATIRGNVIDNPGPPFMGTIQSGVRVADDDGTGANQSITIVGNQILGDGDERGIDVQPGGATGQVDAHFNRIFGNGAGLVSATSFDATNNWWGCNGGPGAPGCDSASGADTDPWLVLTIDAAPTRIEVNGKTSTITADVLRNSNGNTPVGNVFPDGTPIGFTTDLGSLSSTVVPTEDQDAQTILTSGATKGIATITAALDNAAAKAPVEFFDSSVPSASCFGQAATIVVPSDSDDPVSGTDGPDVIVGSAGDDEISGLGGDDLICGLGGRDEIRGNEGQDQLQGNEGQDLMRGNTGNDDLRGSANADVLIGGAGDDKARGGGRQDTIIGGRGADTLNGGTGNDALRGKADDDTLKGGPGRDTLRGGGGENRCIIDQPDTLITGCQDVVGPA